jgi:hypothetical protein
MGLRMALKDPVAVYTAETSGEARLVRHLLSEAGVEAYTTEDFSQVGLRLGDADFDRPQVWVDRSDAERAAPILQEFQEHKANPPPSREIDPGPVEAVCEECGQAATFPGSQRGSVQDCPHCGAMIDVGGDEDGDWYKEEGEGRAQE